MRKKTNSRSRFLFLSLSLLLVITGLPLISYAQHQADSLLGKFPAGILLNRVALNSVFEGSFDDMGLAHADAIRGFYESRKNHPIWIAYHDRETIVSVVSLLAESWTHGLNPENYHAAEAGLLLQKPMLTQQEKARLELLLTDGVVKYSRDITGMRVDAASLREDATYWRQPWPAKIVLDNLAGSRDPVAMLRSLTPRGSLYEKLRNELVSLSRQSESEEDRRNLDFGQPFLSPGENHPEVKRLRRRLGVSHNPVHGGETLYDDRLAAAVIKLQKGSNLTPDGVIGPDTLAVLNFTRDDRIKQVIANMERMRWMNQESPPRYLLVNIPSQKLWAIENGKAVHEMRVVVGRPERPTKRFTAQVTGIRFNPDWTVPLSIKMKDFLPKLQDDPYALSDRGIEMIQGYGREAVTLDPGSIDWHNISHKEMNAIRMVQSPGDHNALGRIRVLMPNQYDIYLHDTNQPELFADDERAYSSGCVRIAEPRKIVSFILGGNPEWSDTKIDEYLADNLTIEVTATDKIPVYIVYQTMWLDDEGRLVYGPDVYDKDRQLIKALASADAFYIPEKDREISGNIVATSLASASAIQ